MGNIILYTTSCPKCKILKTKLKEKGVDYQEVIDINIMKEKGFHSVPMLEVNGETMNFTQANTWINERNSI